MLELKDVIELVGVIVMVLTAYFKLDSKANTIAVKLENHKENHSDLVERVEKHEEKIDNELRSMHQKIDKNHKEISDKLSDIKETLATLKR